MRHHRCIVTIPTPVNRRPCLILLSRSFLDAKIGSTRQRRCYRRNAQRAEGVGSRRRGPARRTTRCFAFERGACRRVQHPPSPHFEPRPRSPPATAFGHEIPYLRPPSDSTGTRRIAGGIGRTAWLVPDDSDRSDLFPSYAIW